MLMISLPEPGTVIDVHAVAERFVAEFSGSILEGDSFAAKRTRLFEYVEEARQAGERVSQRFIESSLRDIEEMSKTWGSAVDMEFFLPSGNRVLAKIGQYKVELASVSSDRSELEAATYFFNELGIRSPMSPSEYLELLRTAKRAPLDG